MLFIGSSRKPIVLHEISNRIPLVIGNLSFDSFNIKVNEHETLINGTSVPFVVFCCVNLEVRSLDPNIVKQVFVVKNIIGDSNKSDPMTDSDLFCLHKQLGHCMPEPLIRVIRNSGKTWSGITVAVERVVSTCKVCSLHKRKPNRKHAALHCRWF